MWKNTELIIFAMGATALLISGVFCGWEKPTVAQNLVSKELANTTETRYALLFGTLIYTKNPPFTQPPLPGMVWALRSGEDIYFLVDDGFLWDYYEIQRYGNFSENDRVVVAGIIEERLDIFGNPYFILIIKNIYDLEVFHPSLLQLCDEG
jgi:hypothetical protein